MGGSYRISFYKEVALFGLGDCKRIISTLIEMGARYKASSGYWSDEKSSSVTGNLEEAINDVYKEGGSIHLFYQSLDFHVGFRLKGYTNIKNYGEVSLSFDRVFFRLGKAEGIQNYTELLRFVGEIFKLINPVYAEAYYEEPNELITDELLDKLKNQKTSLEELKKEMSHVFEIKKAKK